MIITKTLPTSILWKYKEFDRNTEGHNIESACMGFRITSLENLSKDISANGIKKPLTLTVFRNINKVLVTDGNHRLAVATGVNLQDCPVNIEFFEDLTDLNYKHYIESKIVNAKLIESDIKSYL